MYVHLPGYARIIAVLSSYYLADTNWKARWGVSEIRGRAGGFNIMAPFVFRWWPVCTAVYRLAQGRAQTPRGYVAFLCVVPFFTFLDLLPAVLPLFVSRLMGVWIV